MHKPRLMATLALFLVTLPLGHCASACAGHYVPTTDAIDSSPTGPVPTAPPTVADAEEAGLPDDASAPIDSSAPTSTGPCDGAHFFCDDFDRGALGGKWSYVRSGDGTLSLGTPAASAPFSLVAEARTLNVATPMLEKRILRTEKVRVAVDIMVDQASSAEAVPVAIELLGQGDSSIDARTLAVTSTATDARYEQSTATHIDVTSVRLPRSSWHRLTFTFDGVILNTRATLAVDGTVVGAHSFPRGTYGTMVLRVGLPILGTGAGVRRARIDNVVVDEL